jgi:hypothetical protein
MKLEASSGLEKFLEEYRVAEGIREKAGLSKDWRT